jgi:hypothetical protein
LCALQDLSSFQIQMEPLDLLKHYQARPYCCDCELSETCEFASHVFAVCCPILGRQETILFHMRFGEVLQLLSFNTISHDCDISLLETLTFKLLNFHWTSCDSIELQEKMIWIRDDARERMMITNRISMCNLFATISDLERQHN